MQMVLPPKTGKMPKAMPLKGRLIASVLSGHALAQDKASADKAGPKVVQEADKVVVRKRTVIDFNDVSVEGELTKPEGSSLLNRNKTRFQSLIRRRDNFNP